MKVLLACEESQAVCKEFRALGHEAYSCDLYECSGGHPEWHIKGDCLPILNGVCEFTTQNGDKHSINTKWDLIIAFPPCTHLAVSGARHFEKKRQSGVQSQAIEFFAQMLNADCDRIAVENPINIISGDYIKTYYPELCEKYALPKKQNQIIHPYMFGDEFEKSTCLWLKGLPLLQPTNIVGKGEFFEWTDKKTGKVKRQPKWFFDALRTAKSTEERSKIRSKTFLGIAKAMAQQWGKLTHQHDKGE